VQRPGFGRTKEPKSEAIYFLEVTFGRQAFLSETSQAKVCGYIFSLVSVILGRRSSPACCWQGPLEDGSGALNQTQFTHLGNILIKKFIQIIKKENDHEE
jgi:hypothetical protein